MDMTRKGAAERASEETKKEVLRFAKKNSVWVEERAKQLGISSKDKKGTDIPIEELVKMFVAKDEFWTSYPIELVNYDEELYSGLLACKREREELEKGGRTSSAAVNAAKARAARHERVRTTIHDGIAEVEKQIASLKEKMVSASGAACPLPPSRF